MENKQNKINNLLKMGFILVSILFAMPSILYLIQKGTTYQFGPYFHFLYEAPVSRATQTILYIILLLSLSMAYFAIVKRRKNVFKSTKNMFLFIGIVAFIFIAVLPFTCSDVFYYLGIGRLDSTYHQNPYYTTIKEFVEQGDNSQYLQTDTVLAQGYHNDWADSTVVYGPIWTLICRIVAGLSFGNLDFALLLFKLVNVMIHLGNCYLIYKISHKKIFVLLYGLNPFILIEGIASVHNDMFVAFFLLGSLYCLTKKKNLVLSITFLSLATAIKYFAILLLPFIIMYHFRQEEKPRKRLGRCIQYGLLFLAILAIPYLFYVRDAQVLSGLLIQQEKLAKSFYIILTEYFKEPTFAPSTVNHVLLGAFTIIYFFTCLTLLNKKSIKLREEMKKANYFVMAFLFLLITNFQPWYVIWLFPLLIWQKAENIRWIPQIALISEFANSIFLTYGEGWQNGTPFTFVLIVGAFGTWIINEQTKKIKLQKMRRKQFWQD
ncbi:MAG: hypothetical protein HFJ33_05615 [Clostridia bacterium]|nr:hypothetical protein [Clostridia bacterium]